MKTIIAGSRDFNNYDKVCEVCSQYDITEVVSGGARGADLLGERYAQEHSITLKVFPAEWDKYGKSAGYRRNEQMAAYAEQLIAFWDGCSHGTKHMIDFARQLKLNVVVIMV